MTHDPFQAPHPVIAIDGPAKSGKSTVARKLAKKLHFIHLNSGALFRAVALEANRRGIDLTDERSVSSLPDELRFSFSLESSGDTVLRINGEVAPAEIDSSEVGEWASSIAVFPALRERLLRVQREASARTPLVVEGRDAGTAVFPNAPWKFFLDASEEIRVARRFEQLRLGGGLPTAATEEEQRRKVREELAARDQRDSTRAIAPQVAALDAEIIDCGALTPDEVVDRIAEKVGFATPK